MINFLLMQSREMFLFRTCNTITVGDGCVGVGGERKFRSCTSRRSYVAHPN